jgi:hypothetical protein
MTTYRLLALCLATLSFSACPAPRLKSGTLMHPVRERPLARSARFSVSVAMPTDRRPAIERKGDTAHTTALIFLGLFAYYTERGNRITDDRALSPALTQELHTLTRRYLAQSGVFTHVRSAGKQADFLLTTDVLHLYGSQYQARSFMAGGGANNHSSSYSAAGFGVYGNVVLRCRLYDLRSGKKHFFWERYVVGTAKSGAASVSETTAHGDAARLATRDALARLTRVVGGAVRRYAPAPFDGKTYRGSLARQRQSRRLRFIVQRLSPDRSKTEFLTIDDASGAAIGRSVERTRGTSFGRPGDWMLSRRRLDGSAMPLTEHASLARFLANDYDLRRVDDIHHFHYFGRKTHTNSSK